MSDPLFLAKAQLHHGNYWIVKYTKENEFAYKLHYHDFYEVQLYPYDSGTLVINEQEHELQGGEIVLINIFEPHMFLRKNNSKTERYSISLAPDLLLSLCSKSSNILTIFNKRNPNYPIMRLNNNAFAKYLGILNQLNNINIAHGRDILERSLLYKLVAYLYDQFYSEVYSNPLDLSAITTVIKLLSYIDEHISEDLSLERLAAEVNFSKFYTCKLFKKYTGNTLNNYIVSKRLEKSAYFLTESISIGEVCKKFGFNNYSYFYKAFKKMYGVNPSEFKTSVSKNIDI